MDVNIYKLFCLTYEPWSDLYKYNQATLSIDSTLVHLTSYGSNDKMVEICFKIKWGAQARGRVSQGECCWKEVGLIRFSLCSCIHLRCSLVMFSFFFFMCIEAHVSVLVCVCTLKPEVDIWCLSWIVLYFICWDGVSRWAWSSLVWQVRLKNLPVSSTSPVLRLQMCTLIFILVLRIWVQALMLEWQALRPMSHPQSP